MHNHIAQIVKATCAALVFSLLYVLIFALIIKLFGVSTQVVKPVNQAFKILIIALGGFLFVRGERRLIKGALYGVVACLCTYLLYGAIAASLSFSWLIFAELILGAAAGLIGSLLGAIVFRE